MFSETLGFLLNIWEELHFIYFFYFIKLLTIKKFNTKEVWK